MLKRVLKIFISIFIISFLVSNLANGEIIKKIEISGNDRIPNETILMLSTVKVGDIVTEKKLNNLIIDLYNTNFFNNISVKVENNILKLSVDENQIISDIKIIGIKANRIKEAINEVLSIREKSSLNELILKDEKAKMLNVLKSQGYIQANIKILKETITDNKVNLIFDIDLGKKAKIKKLYLLEIKFIKTKNLKE